MKLSARTMIAGVLTALAFGALGTAGAAATTPEFVTAQFPIKAEISGGETQTFWSFARRECKHAEAEVIITAANSAIGRSHIVNCYSGSTNTWCMNGWTGKVGESERLIKSNILNVRLGIINTKPEEVGLELEAQSGENWASEVLCGTAELHPITGGIIGWITPINTMPNKFTITWRSSSFKQEPSSFADEEGSPKQFLKYGSEDLGIQSKLTLVTASDFEIKT
jgi:hypothetical protein